MVYMSRKEKREEGQRLARSQGAVFDQALEYAQSQFTNIQAETGDYRVTVLVGEAEGAYIHQEDESLEWVEAGPGYNCHLSVVIQDKQDRRFVPGLKVYCKIFDAEEELMGDQQEPFSWHPYLYHYGLNWYLPASGLYNFELSIYEPLFDRHDKELGRRYERPVTLQLGPMEIKIKE